MRQKKPDKKKALSLLASADKEMRFTLSLPISDFSSSTIVRNIYECFRKLGDALLVSRGIEAQDLIAPIRELMRLDIETPRPLNILDNMRRTRHNINYYGYVPSEEETRSHIRIAEQLFRPVYEEVKRRVEV